jgi:transcription antitermination factor NusG
LAAKGLHPFLPTIPSWSVRAGRQHQVRIPMFAGYLFLHGVVDKNVYIEVRKSRGLVSILGQGWDRLATIPDRDIAAIQFLLGADLPVAPHPYLRDGRRVRVMRGPLAGLEGILVRLDSRKGRLVLSLDLLQRSVAAEVDCSAVAAA